MRKTLIFLLAAIVFLFYGCATVNNNSSTSTTTSTSLGTSTTTTTTSTGSTTTNTLINWIFDPDSAMYYSSPAIGASGTIYIGAGYWLTFSGARVNRGLYAVNPDGSQKWFCSIDEDLFSPAVGTDETIYVQDWDNNLYAIDPDTGVIDWTYATGAQSENIGCATPAIGSDGTIYMAGAQKTLYAVSPEGTTKWTFQPTGPGAPVHSSPAVGPDGKIYVQMGDTLYAVHATGTQEWSCSISAQSFSSPAIDSSGYIYIGRESSGGISYVYSISPEGTIRWSHQVSGSRDVRSAPAIGSDGTIYIATKASDSASAEVLALNNSDGSEKWSYTNTIPNNDFYCSPAIGSDGKVYVADEWGYLRAFDPTNGNVVWEVQDPGNGAFNWSSPAIASDGTLYIGNTYNGLFSFDSPSPGLASSDWPKFHHDNLNTGRR